MHDAYNAAKACNAAVLGTATLALAATCWTDAAACVAAFSTRERARLARGSAPKHLAHRGATSVYRTVFKG